MMIPVSFKVPDKGRAKERAGAKGATPFFGAHLQINRVRIDHNFFDKGAEPDSLQMANTRRINGLMLSKISSSAKQRAAAQCKKTGFSRVVEDLSELRRALKALAKPTEPVWQQAQSSNRSIEDRKAAELLFALNCHLSRAKPLDGLLTSISFDSEQDTAVRLNLLQAAGLRELEILLADLQEFSPKAFGMWRFDLSTIPPELLDYPLHALFYLAAKESPDDVSVTDSVATSLSICAMVSALEFREQHGFSLPATPLLQFGQSPLLRLSQPGDAKGKPWLRVPPRAMYFTPKERECLKLIDEFWKEYKPESDAYKPVSKLLKRVNTIGLLDLVSGHQQRRYIQGLLDAEAHVGIRCLRLIDAFYTDCFNEKKALRNMRDDAAQMHIDWLAAALPHLRMARQGIVEAAERLDARYVA